MPRAELTVYFKKLNRSTPAGMEINVRTIGINLPRKIPMHPFYIGRESCMERVYL